MPRNNNDEQDGVRYEVRTLPDRWAEPMGHDVISVHSTADAALDAFQSLPQRAADGTGRSTYGSFVPSIVIRVNADGSESVTTRRPLAAPRTDPSGGGRW